MSRSRILIPLVLCIPLLLTRGCQKETTTSPSGGDQTSSTESYFPLNTGAAWNYRVTFPADAQVPYVPTIEYPEGLTGSSVTHGVGTWSQGSIEFSVTVGSRADSSATGVTYNVTLSGDAAKFFFYVSGNYVVQLRKKSVGTALLYDMIGNLPIGSPSWKVARCLLKLSADSLKNTVDVTVPAGVYKSCVKSAMNIVGDGRYVPSGTYPVEVYSAANVGIVKMVGKGKDGTVLYTMELLQSLTPPTPQTNFTGVWIGTYSSSLVPTVAVTFNIVQTGTTISGTYSSLNGASGTISGTVGTTNTFTLTQTTSSCSGSFSGIATVSVDTMTFTYTGSDCLGIHANGKGRVVRTGTTTNGSIYVTSVPSGASVTLDGVSTGRSTSVTLTDVTAGSHSLRLSKSGYADTTLTVIVSQSQTTNVAITLRSVATSSDSIYVILKLAALPKTMKFNQNYVPDYYTEHRWSILFDTDNNSSTGLGGFDIEICCDNYKVPGSSPSMKTPIAGTTHEVVEWKGDTGYVRHSNVVARLDPNDTNTIIMVGPATWTELAAIGSTDPFYFETYYRDTTRSALDWTDVNTGSSIVTDAVGDATYGFVDIVSGQWLRGGSLSSAGWRNMRVEFSTARHSSGPLPARRAASVYFDGTKYRARLR